MKNLLLSVKSFFIRSGRWLAHEGKTTTVAVLYATAETLLAMPDLSTMTREDFLKRTVRICSVTAIGLLAKDRLPVSEDKKNVDG